MSNTDSNIVEVYWSGVAQRLDAEVEVLNRLVPHRGEQGRANEITLYNLLSSLLPSNVGVGSGIVIDHEGTCSNQIDIVIFDKASQPQILAQTTQMLFPVETVLMAIEVKTTLSEDEVATCAQAKTQLDQLSSPAGAMQIPYLLVAYKANLLPKTLGEKIQAIDVEKRPDTLCVLSPGIIGGRAQHLSNEEGSGSDQLYIMGFVPLHASNAEKQKISKTWEEPDEGERGQPKVVRNNRTYPVAAMSQSDRRKYVGEPGRTLLLFCQSMLSQLFAQSVVRTPFLQYYLSGLASEIESLW
jgi:hypothetical protein